MKSFRVLGLAVLLVTAGMIGTASAAPASMDLGKTQVAPGALEKGFEQARCWRRCWWRHGHRHCTWHCRRHRWW
jgi:hypothetical protein